MTINRNYYVVTRHKEASLKGLRFCPKCDNDKTGENFEFPKGSRSKRAWCNDCRLMKVCPKCLKNLPRKTHYQQLSKGTKRNHAYCLDCDRVYQREWKLQSQYAISTEEYNRMNAEQKGQCYLCNTARKLVVDHNHLNGKVRHLLCDLCNRGLGYFKDNPEVLRSAATYVEEVSLSV